MTFIPSPEQQAIFDAVLNTTDNVAIAALAGTGKTTSLVELSKRLPTNGSKIFCAFNKDIVNELEGRLTGTGVRASTFHSIGFSALKKHLGAQSIVPQGDKYKKLVDDWGNTDGVLSLTLSDAVQVYPHEDRPEKMRDLRKATLSMFVDLLNLARLKLAGWDDANALQSIIHEYALDTDVEYEGLVELVIRNVEHVMKQAEEQTRKLVIDFTDMIYWAVHWNLTFYQYQWVMVDECQDLSPVQREMIARIISPRGGRIVLVGDPNQAIYAFAGADSDSFNLSVQRWNCTVLPLTMTRRCATIITQHASNLVPSFRCPEDKPRGKVVWLPEGSLQRHAKVGDMVLSRIKAPLVEQCLALIGDGIPAMILGADIGKALVTIIEKLTKRKDYTFTEILKCLTNYCNEQMDIAKKKGDDARAEAIYDQCQAVKFVIEAYPDAQSIDALTDKINSLFGDGKKFSEVVTFATIHKSKGLEADRVFILAPDKLPLRAKNMTPEQEQQEGNLDYVARTRAKNILVYITNKKFLENTPRYGYIQEDFEDKVWDAPVLPDTIAPVTDETPTDFPQTMNNLLASCPARHGYFSISGETKMYVGRHSDDTSNYIVERADTSGGNYVFNIGSLQSAIDEMGKFNNATDQWTPTSAGRWLVDSSTETYPPFHTVVGDVLSVIGTFNVLYAQKDDIKMCVSYSTKWHSYIVKTITPDGKESEEIITASNDTLHVMKRFEPNPISWQFLTFSEWEAMHTVTPVVDAPETAYDKIVAQEKTNWDNADKFISQITEQLTTLPTSSGLFAVDGDVKMYVSRNIIRKEEFFVETANGEYTQQFLTLDEALAKMEAFSPIISTWHVIASNDWMFATAQHKTMKERKAEEQPTPLVEASAPLPFASIMKQHLTELLTTYDPDRGLCADGETTTMYITTNWDEEYVIYERDYINEDDMHWSRDSKEKNTESVLKKMEAINANPDAWRIVIWGEWIDGVHNESSTPMEIETPSADANVEMIVKLLRIPESPEVLELAQAIYTASLEHLPNINVETLAGISKLQVSLRKVMREHNYPPAPSGIYMDTVVDDIALFLVNGTLPDAQDPLTEMVAEIGGVIVADEPPADVPVTPSADALLIDMIAKCLDHPTPEAGANLARAIHTASAPILIGLDWKSRHDVANMRIAIKRVMREHEYPPSWTKNNMNDVVDALAHLFEHGSLPDEFVASGAGTSAIVPDDTTTTPESTDAHTEASQPIVSASPVVAPIPDDTPADTIPTVAPTFSNGENPPPHQNGKDTNPTPEPLPSTAPEMLQTLIDQFRVFELPELDLVQQAIDYIKREKEAVSA